MEQLLAIFSSLGVDETILHQFVIFLVLYLILKQLFLKKLQFVLELRESKTTKLEGEAIGKFQEAEKLAAEYKAKIEEANTEGQRLISHNRSEVVSQELGRVKELEAELSKKLDAERDAFLAEMETQKSAILDQSDKLSEELVGKLI